MAFPTIILKRNARDIALPYSTAAKDWIVCAASTGKPIEYTIRAGMLELRDMPMPCGTARCLVISAIRAARDGDDPRATFPLRRTTGIAEVDDRKRFAHDETTCEQIARIHRADAIASVEPLNRQMAFVSAICVSDGARPSINWTFERAGAYCGSATARIELNVDIGAPSVCANVPQLSAATLIQTEYMIGVKTASCDAIIRAVQRDGATALVNVIVYARVRDNGSELAYDRCFCVKRVVIDECESACAQPPPYAPATAPAPCPPHVEDGRDTCAMADVRDPAWKCAQPRAPGSVFCEHHRALMALL